MVDVFEIRGKVDLDLEPFTSKIATANEQLMELGKGINLNFLEKNDFLGKIDLLKDKLGQVGVEAEKITTAFTKIEGLERVLEQLDLVKEKVATVKTEVDSVNTSTNNVAKATAQWGEALASVSPNFQSMMYSMEAIQGKTVTALGEIGSLLVEEGSQIKKNTTYYEQELQVAKQFENAEQGLISGYVEQGRAIEQANALEKQRLATLREEMSVAKRLGDTYLKNAREQNRQLTYEREMLMVEEQFSTVIGDEIASKFQYNALLEESVALEKEILSLIGDSATMTGEEIAEETKKLNTLREELDLNREILNLEKQQTMEEAKQTEEKISGMGASAKGNKLDKLGYLPSRIGSMAVTMLGYQEIMDVWEKTTSNINAKTQFNSYADLLKTDNRYLKQTKQSTADVTKGINELNKSLTDTYKGGRSLQQMYSKVDMRQVGANALDTAFKYGVQAENLDELTEVMAIYSSEFVRQGRSQEDSILAVNDALDGEFRRLKEVNIGKEDLEAHGYEEGNTLSLIRAMREIAEERGYDVTAQKITTLSEAINQAELELAFLLSDLFELAEPSLIYALGKIVELFRWIGDGVKQLKDYLKGLPQPTKDFLKVFGGNVMLGLVGLWIGKKIWGAVSNMSLFGKAWGKLMEKLGKTKGMDKASESIGDFTNSTTGGTKGTGGGFKENFKAQWGKLGKDLGIMARVFVDVAVALAMAFFLIEEGILIISGIGYTYESLKPQFEQGIQFIQEYGIWFALLGGALLGVSYLLKDIPTETMAQVGKGALNVAMGIGIAMGLVAVAIGSLLMPLGAIISLGALANWQQGNLDKGIEVLHMFADALNQITLPVGLFIGALLVASVVLGYAPMLGVGLAIGIAISIGLVAEAIFMLNAPLLAIASLGVVAQTLGQSNIQQGADALKIVGQALKTIADAVPSLLLVDFGVLGQELMDIGSKLLTGKDGLSYLSEEIIPNLSEFVESFNGVTINPIDTTTVANLSQVASQLPSIKSSIDTIRGSVGNGGTGGMNIFGFQIGGDTSSLKPKLDTLYESIKDVMDFANKLGNLSTTTTGGVTSVNAVSNAVTQLQAKLRSMVNVINTASVQVKASAKGLGSGITQGFKTGSASFGATVVSVLAKGVSEIQSRYNTFNNGGKTLGQKMIDGFKNHKPSLKTITSREISYALTELDNAKDDFYTKGKALGSELTRGYEDGADIHSPGLIARTTVRELRYTMDALDTGKKMMYQGGVALGQALTNGYNSYGNIKTDVGVLASKGVSNEQLQANAKNTQLNGNQKGKTPQLTQTNINIDMSNSTVIGVQDLDNKIRQAVEKAIVSINSPNGAIGY